MLVFKLSLIIQEQFQGIITDYSVKILSQGDLIVICRYFGMTRKAKVIKEYIGTDVSLYSFGYYLLNVGKGKRKAPNSVLRCALKNNDS